MAADRLPQRGSKPVLASTWPYQCGAHTPSAAWRPAGQMEHRRIPGDPERPAQLRQRALRLGQHIGAVDDRRRMAEPVALAVEKLALEPQPQVRRG